MQAFRFAAAASLAALISAPAFAQTDTAAPAAAPAPAAAESVASISLPAKGDTIETLRASGRFNILLRGLDATNLTGVIKAQTSLTVFAPTDDAFAALPPGELARLTRDPSAMQQLLTYHLINTPVDPAKLAGGRSQIATVGGAGLVLDGSGAGLMANDAHVLIAGVKTPNGLVYVVDKVLTPAGAAAAATPAAPAP